VRILDEENTVSYTSLTIARHSTATLNTAKKRAAMAEPKKPTMSQIKNKMIRVLKGRTPPATSAANGIFYDLLVDGVKRARADDQGQWPENPDQTDVSKNVRKWVFMTNPTPFKESNGEFYYDAS